MWEKMRRAFSGFDDLTVISVSPWLMERARRSPILADKRHQVIYNGVDTNVFHPYETNQLRDQMRLVGKKIIFHATPHFSVDPNHFKGGYYVCELAKRMPDAFFLVAGTHTKDIVVPKNVLLLGRIADQRLLAQYYSMADVTLLTSKKETFSMVTAESLCCGTPVVGFKAGGPEQIALPAYSRFVEYGDVEALFKAVEISGNKNKSIISESSKMQYSFEKTVMNYIKLYEAQ